MRRKSVLWRCVALVFFWASALVQAGATPSAWVAHNRAGHQVYLVGSIHVGTANLYPLPVAIEAAFKGAQVLAVELDISQLDAAAVAPLMQELGYFPSDSPGLASRISTSLWRRLEHYCAVNTGCPPAALRSRMRPWLLSLHIVNTQLAASGFQPAWGVDRYFLSRRADQQLLELESLAGQMALFSALSDGAQSALLEQSLMADAEASAAVADLVAAWRVGDDAALERLVLAPLRASTVDASLYERLFVQRNEAMAQRIAQVAAHTAVTFVVVGAGHLLGEQGLPALLRAQGFEVESL